MRLLFTLLAVVMAAWACSGNPADPDGTGEMDYARVLQGLLQSGLAAEPAGQVSQPFMSVPARVIAIGSEQVQVFEYSDERSAEADAARVSADGGRVWNSLITWIAPPHFYRRGRVVTLYVGDRAEIKAALERLLGPQFAGR